MLNVNGKPKYIISKQEINKLEPHYKLLNPYQVKLNNKIINDKISYSTKKQIYKKARINSREISKVNTSNEWNHHHYCNTNINFYKTKNDKIILQTPSKKKNDLLNFNSNNFTNNQINKIFSYNNTERDCSTAYSHFQSLQSRKILNLKPKNKTKPKILNHINDVNSTLSDRKTFYTLRNNSITTFIDDRKQNELNSNFCRKIDIDMNKLLSKNYTNIANKNKYNPAQKSLSMNKLIEDLKEPLILNNTVNVNRNLNSELNNFKRLIESNKKKIVKSIVNGTKPPNFAFKNVYFSKVIGNIFKKIQYLNLKNGIIKEDIALNLLDNECIILENRVENQIKRNCKIKNYSKIDIEHKNKRLSNFFPLINSVYNSNKIKPIIEEDYLNSLIFSNMTSSKTLNKNNFYLKTIFREEGDDGISPKRNSIMNRFIKNNIKNKNSKELNFKTIEESDAMDITSSNFEDDYFYEIFDRETLNSYRKFLINFGFAPDENDPPPLIRNDSDVGIMSKAQKVFIKENQDIIIHKRKNEIKRRGVNVINLGNDIPTDRFLSSRNVIPKNKKTFPGTSINNKFLNRMKLKKRAKDKSTTQKQSVENSISKKEDRKSKNNNDSSSFANKDSSSIDAHKIFKPFDARNRSKEGSKNNNINNNYNNNNINNNSINENNNNFETKYIRSRDKKTGTLRKDSNNNLLSNSRRNSRRGSLQMDLGNLNNNQKFSIFKNACEQAYKKKQPEKKSELPEKNIDLNSSESINGCHNLQSNNSNDESYDNLNIISSDNENKNTETNRSKINPESKFSNDKSKFQSKNYSKNISSNNSKLQNENNESNELSDMENINPEEEEDEEDEDDEKDKDKSDKNSLKSNRSKENEEPNQEIVNNIFSFLEGNNLNINLSGEDAKKILQNENLKNQIRDLKNKLLTSQISSDLINLNEIKYLSEAELLQYLLKKKQILADRKISLDTNKKLVKSGLYSLMSKISKEPRKKLKKKVPSIFKSKIFKGNYDNNFMKKIKVKYKIEKKEVKDDLFFSDPSKYINSFKCKVREVKIEQELKYHIASAQDTASKEKFENFLKQIQNLKKFDTANYMKSLEENYDTFNKEIGGLVEAKETEERINNFIFNTNRELDYKGIGRKLILKKMHVVDTDPTFSIETVKNHQHVKSYFESQKINCKRNKKKLEKECESEYNSRLMSFSNINDLGISPYKTENGG